MSLNGHMLIKTLNQLAHPKLAVPKDKIGLQVGRPDAPVDGIFITLDVTEAVVDEAIALGANWIVAHHAVIFNPLTEIRTDQEKGRLLAKLLQHNMQVFIAHTNLDTALGGVNDVLAEKLQLAHTEVLIPHYHEPLKKLVVFVPETHIEQVREAISKAGAGHIGRYSHCTFNLAGEGTFMPQEGTSPYIGHEGKLEQVREIRLETIITGEIEDQVLQHLYEAHPYEEIAYDIYLLENRGTAYGLGRIGDLPREMTVKQFAAYVKECYGVKGLRVVGRSDGLVQRVAVLGGSGGRYFDHAKQKGADAYITGDIDFHTAQDALASEMVMIDPGHHIEHLAMAQFAEHIREKLKQTIPIHVSKVDTNPFWFV
ncbi:Nif3-like dinuclear metal center hexameric protein [Hazenella sp. IB182357]|uniref:GTP cyclohydrolase 1 type 2 homolog n=1 Tax=Polycladospora coralii TaxID=2771432 RepID=A0A926RSH0_9BACL|nr:Nif3-like dinuclear metal center hexameric protein [Polycladospora coralii]MBD1371190.1 Nif3-like dinuclear metal center hexameric protein [Polycladospora coralii]MBS7530132.1 Nif3-like dinuclear metal center hexameric protein [Polycladospora coralii]